MNSKRFSRTFKADTKLIEMKLNHTFINTYHIHSYLALNFALSRITLLTPSFFSTERNQRSKYHERGTSAERRYKRSNRRSPTSGVHRRHHYRHHSHHRRPREHHRHRHRRSSSDRTEDKSPYLNNHVSIFYLVITY